jgi:hypothetical protein
LHRSVEGSRKSSGEATVIDRGKRLGDGIGREFTPGSALATRATSTPSKKEEVEGRREVRRRQPVWEASKVFFK